MPKNQAEFCLTTTFAKIFHFEISTTFAKALDSIDNKKKKKKKKKKLSGRQNKMENVYFLIPNLQQPAM